MILYPDYYCQDVTKITPSFLKEHNIKGLILDVDNTLIDIDRKLLNTMIVQYEGKPVGIEALAVTIGEEVETIEDVYEPYLIQIGFVARTVRGRVAMPAAYAHMGIAYEEA